jgi:hypothetical protein
VRLDVAVAAPLPVGVRQRRAHRLQDVDDFRRRQWAAPRLPLGEELRQAEAVDELQHQAVQLTAGVRVVENLVAERRHDGRVPPRREPLRHLDLLHETAAGLGLGHQPQRRHLDRDHLAGAHLRGAGAAVDAGHAAAADLRLDAVLAVDEEAARQAAPGRHAGAARRRRAQRAQGNRQGRGAVTAVDPRQGGLRLAQVALRHAAQPHQPAQGRLADAPPLQQGQQRRGALVTAAGQEVLVGAVEGPDRVGPGLAELGPLAQQGRLDEQRLDLFQAEGHLPLAVEVGVELLLDAAERQGEAAHVAGAGVELRPPVGPVLQGLADQRGQLLSAGPVRDRQGLQPVEQGGEGGGECFQPAVDLVELFRGERLPGGLHVRYVGLGGAESLDAVLGRSSAFGCRTC